MVVLVQYYVGGGVWQVGGDCCQQKVEVSKEQSENDNFSLAIARFLFRWRTSGIIYGPHSIHGGHYWLSVRLL